MRVIERYASAVHATSLKSDPATYMSDTDVLGAMGLAAKYEPLGAALTRLLEGGGSADAIDALATMIFKRARKGDAKMTAIGANDMAKAVLAWHRHGTCQPCGGTGYARIVNTPVNGDECGRCGGTGKIPFDRQFDPHLLPLASWASSQIEYSISAAADAAMRKIAPRLDL